MLIKLKNRPGGRSVVVGTTMMLYVHDLGLRSETGAHSDGVALAGSALAHELGHVMGFEDEYIEAISPGIVQSVDVAWEGPRLPRFNQSTEGRPFAFDHHAMMAGNCLPRLRYVFPLLRRLEREPSIRAVLGHAARVVRYPSFHGGITYGVPDSTVEHPWTLMARARLSRGFGDLLLYHLGDDEGSVEAMFGPLPPERRVDGLMLVRTKFWFDFARGAARDFRDDVERFLVIHEFNSLFYDVAGRPSPSLLLQGPSARRLPNLALVLQPHYEFGPQPTNALLRQEADLIVEVLQDEGSPELGTLVRLNDSHQLNRRLRVGRTQVGPALMRYALNIGPWVAGPDGSSIPVQDDLQPSDFVGLLPQISAILGEPPHSRTVSAL